MRAVFRQGPGLRVLLSTVVSCALFGNAHAGGVQDGEAGLAASDRGDYSEAVRLITKALSASDLDASDRELAYLNRGKAYLAEGDQAHGVADLREAVRLKADDAEAREALHQALSAASAVNVPQSADEVAPWGLLGRMSGQYYWYEVPGVDPHTAYLMYAWITPGKVLSAVVRNKKGVAAAVEFVLNDDGRRLLMAGQYATGAVYGTAASRGDTAYEWSYQDNTAVTDTLRREADGSVTLTQTRFANGRWQPQDGSARLVETSNDEIAAQGFKKIP